MKKKYYSFLIVYASLLVNFVSAYDITLVTSKGEKISIESELLWEKQPSPFVKNNGMYSLFDTIQCPTIFKETFERILMLLIYKKEGDISELIQYLKMTYATITALAIADIFNTLAFLKLDNNLLEQCLQYCPEDKRKTVFSLCSDSLFEKIKLFNAFLRLKMPLNNGFTRTFDISANKACLLPRVCEMNDLFMGSNNEFYFDKKLPEIVLPEKCVPHFDTVVELESFFKVFFDTIFRFEHAISDYSDFFNKLFNKPELQLNYNISVFCNLLDFFQLSLLVDCILEYFAFNSNNIDFKKRNFEEIPDNFLPELQIKHEKKKSQIEKINISVYSKN